MAHEDYDNIELTQEEMDGLNDIIISPETGDGESTVSQGETTDKVEDAVQSAEDTTEEASTEETEAVVEDGFELDGERYTREEIQAWREDSDNKVNWQKSNTEKAQHLSKWSKFSEKIQEDENLLSHIKDYFFDDPEAIKALGLDGDLPILGEETIPELPSEVEQRLKVLEEIEGDRILETRVNHLDDQLTTLEQKFPEYLEGDKVGEFLEFADKNSGKFVDNGIPNLDRAFREWSYAEMQAELSHFKKLGKNNSRNEGKVITTAQVGAKEVKTPKKYSWDNITMDDPEIAKYFENE